MMSINTCSTSRPIGNTGIFLSIDIPTVNIFLSTVTHLLCCEGTDNVSSVETQEFLDWEVPNKEWQMSDPRCGTGKMGNPATKSNVLLKLFFISLPYVIPVIKITVINAT